MNHLISIIVPVYNSGKCLSRCIESILSQTSEDWELILINDGSTDNSAIICDRYANKDSRISVIHQENAGVSCARNVGLRNAKGDWITFCDSDDELFSCAIESYITNISEDIDIIRAGFERKKGEEEFKITTLNTDSEDKEKVLLICNESRYEAYLWNSCFRKSTIGSITFNEKISWCEDHLFTFQVIGKARKIRFISNLVYRYYAHKNEAGSYGSNLSTKYIEPYMIIYEAVLEKNLKISFLPKNASLGLKLIEKEYKYKINLALKYGVDRNRYFLSLKIAVNNGIYGMSKLASIIFHSKISYGMRKILNI